MVVLDTVDESDVESMKKASERRLLLCCELLIGHKRAKVYFFYFIQFVANKSYFFAGVRTKPTMVLI